MHFNEKAFFCKCLPAVAVVYDTLYMKNPFTVGDCKGIFFQ